MGTINRSAQAGPEYPVFAVDTDGYVYRCDSERGLNFFEQVDIEGHEYSCWDARGGAFELTWDDVTFVGLRATGAPPRPQELLKALRNWAKIQRVVVADDLQAPVEIWERIEAGVNSRRWFNRLGRFLAGITRLRRSDE